MTMLECPVHGTPMIQTKTAKSSDSACMTEGCVYFHGWRQVMDRTQRLSHEPCPDFSVCETRFATPFSLFHIRAVDPEVGMKYGGGLQQKALCGRNLHGGWDVEEQLTIATVLGSQTCRPCFTEWMRVNDRTND